MNAVTECGLVIPHIEAIGQPYKYKEMANSLYAYDVFMNSGKFYIRVADDEAKAKDEREALIFQINKYWDSLHPPKRWHEEG